MRQLAVPIAAMFALALPGCVARTAVDIATAPVRAGSQVADWATTSQDEADRARGREIRRREERLADLSDDYDERADDCEAGDSEACREAVAIRREIDELIPTIPVEPD